MIKTLYDLIKNELSLLTELAIFSYVRNLQQAADLYEDGSEDQRNNSHQLDEDVDGRTGSILEGVADGVAGNSSLVGGSTLAVAFDGAGFSAKEAGFTSYWNREYVSIRFISLDG